MTFLTVGQARQAKSLSIIQNRNIDFVADDDAIDPGLVLVNSGFLSADGDGQVTFHVPVAFEGNGLIKTSNLATIVFKDPVVSNGNLTISGPAAVRSPGSVALQVALGVTDLYPEPDAISLSAPSLTINSSYVRLDDDGLFNVGQLNIGDGVGDRVDLYSASPGTYQTALFSSYQNIAQTNITVKRDGTWRLFTTSGAAGLDLQGGEVRLSEGADLLAPALVKATPALTTENVPQVALIRTDGNGRVDLRNSQVEFRAESAFGLLWALEVTAPIANGTLAKTGDGLMLLSGNSSNTYGQTVVKRGTLSLQKGNNATAIPGDITVGDITLPSAAILNSAAGNQIADGAAVTVQYGGEWRLNSFNERVLGVALLGGQVTGTGTLTLGPDANTPGGVVALGMADLPIPTINPNLNLNGKTTPFEAGRFNGPDGPHLVLNGAIGNGSMEIKGTWIRLGGTANNTVTNTIVTAQTLELAKQFQANAVGNGLVVGTADATAGPTVRWLESDQIPNSLAIDFRTGTLDLNGKIDIIGGINASGTGPKSIATGAAGALGVQGDSGAAAGALVGFSGNLDMMAGVRDFGAAGSGAGSPDFTNWAITGKLTRGTLRKTGVGRIELTSVTGDVVLDIADGVVRTNNATLGGLQGAGELNVVAATTIDSPEGTRTFSGLLSGGGHFIKDGAGTLILAGSGANTITGQVSVYDGELKLQKAGGPAILGLFRIESGASATTALDDQFAPAALMAISDGTLNLGSTSQTVHTLGTASATIIGSKTGGQFTVTNVVSLINSELDDVNVNFTGTAELVNTHADIRGVFAQDAKLAGESIVEVQNRSGAGSELRFMGQLEAVDGTTFLLHVGAPGDAPLIDIDGGLLVGGVLASGHPIMIGRLNIALASDELEPGIYDLVDFADSPVTQSIPFFGTASVYPALSNFSLVSPPADGSWQLGIDNNVLRLTVVPVPEPVGGLALAAVPALGLRRRLPRRRA